MSKADGMWWDVSWNPVSGCSPISDGCDNCWARTLANTRLRGRCGYSKDKPFSVTLHPDKLDDPRSWRKPRRVFVCSMGDLFHMRVPADYLWQMFRTMHHCPQHTFMILTKRIERLVREGLAIPDAFIPKNAMIGVTCENQGWLDKRAAELLKIFRVRKFLSLEPLLGPIEVDKYFDPTQCPECEHIDSRDGYDVLGADDGKLFCNKCNSEVEPILPKPIDWVIVGCESGPKRRPCKLEWIASTIDQCNAASVPIWIKQIPIDGKVNHNMNEWPMWARRREWAK